MNNNILIEPGYRSFLYENLKRESKSHIEYIINKFHFIIFTITILIILWYCRKQYLERPLRLEKKKISFMMDSVRRHQQQCHLWSGLPPWDTSSFHTWNNI